MTTARCTQCKKVKPLDDFYKEKRKTNGRESRCKKCSIKKTQRWAAKNPDMHREKSKRYYYAHKDERIAYGRSYYVGNKSKHLAAVRSWRYRNPSKPALYTQRRRTRKAANGVFQISNRELQRLYQSPCAHCGSKDNITVDHIVPISRGGRHSIGNLQPLCKHCNCSKKNKLMVEWKLHRNPSVA